MLGLDLPFNSTETRASTHCFLPLISIHPEPTLYRIELKKKVDQYRTRKSGVNNRMAMMVLALGS